MGENSVDRRFFLSITTTTAIGLALSPTRVFALETATSPEMNALSAYMSAAGARALPADVAEHAKHHLLDSLASMISGSELLPGQAAQRYIRAHGGKAELIIEHSRCRACALPAAPPALSPILEILPVQMITLALAALSGREAGRFDFATKITTKE